MSRMPKDIKVALLMAASLFMEILDGTIVTTALPKMSQYFLTSSATITLIVSVYLITVAIFIPLSGWLTNRFGKKKVWIFAVITFTISSLALTAYNGLSFSEIAPQDRNSANTLNSVFSTLAQGMGISLITVVVNLLQIFFSITAAYELGFVFLGLLMIFPIIETLFLPRNIGHATIS